MTSVSGKGNRSLRLLDEAFVPDERKSEIRKRLTRLKGQLDGIDRMLAENRPCVDILTQLSAVQEALRGATRVMARNYFEKCATNAIRSGGKADIYDEIMDVIFKFTR